ncbi:MAG: FtsX-like permease family protein, partial [Gammaproteobacteria bacterium]|nr:FtsX-like permease family protein [Gammaproteobacteria bacterium]
DGSVALLVLAEAVLLGLVGGALGVGLGTLAMMAIEPQLQQFFGLIEVTWTVVASALGIALLLGLVVGSVPALTARRLSIVDALRAR